ncbi:tRNA pseudouridine(38-40) synthase TruA [Pseudoflavonifractor capillosus]|uniref:tRNA pseudouridine(38-40) synthase TruA n=1 Tax=Pseudoflavonifractor capillosus TaxID=106588 RepID=UPI001959A8B0|nr:tRNA pseudouridine(38-40) synthase TruA [Pseudoflavonifractor capillosus]MBM6694035.1 tRNA pseudouridine(38-40) synthase TruA [Pseudoflavonifractor capillosus]
MNVKLTIQYDGTRYDGWQRQGNTDNTLQGRLEGVLSRMVGKPVEIQGAGRTDAGVHAHGQVASVHLPEGYTPQEIQNYLNRYLPEDVAVVDVVEVGERFHARLSATGKEYRYHIRMGSVPDVFARKYQYRVEEPLDIPAMERAAGYLTGKHDFRSFCGNRRFKKSTVREVFHIGVEVCGSDLTLVYRGDGFLYNMVRILTGTLLEVGLGQRTPESMVDVLEARERTAAGKTAPAQGLVLQEVYYP